MTEQNPLFAVGTSKPKKESKDPMTPQDIASTFAPDPAEVEPEEVETKQPTKQKKEQSVQVPAKLKIDPLPGRGKTAKRRQGQSERFTDRHVTVSLSIDNRIMPYVKDFLERGARRAGNKTVFASQLLLKLLIDAGYEIDPNILSDED